MSKGISLMLLAWLAAGTVIAPVLADDKADRLQVAWTRDISGLRADFEAVWPQYSSSFPQGLNPRRSTRSSLGNLVTVGSVFTVLDSNGNIHFRQWTGRSFARVAAMPDGGWVALHHRSVSRALSDGREAWTIDCPNNALCVDAAPGADGGVVLLRTREESSPPQSLWLEGYDRHGVRRWRSSEYPANPSHALSFLDADPDSGLVFTYTSQDDSNNPSNRRFVIHATRVSGGEAWVWRSETIGMPLMLRARAVRQGGGLTVAFHPNLSDVRVVGLNASGQVIQDRTMQDPQLAYGSLFLAPQGNGYFLRQDGNDAGSSGRLQTFDQSGLSSQIHSFPAGTPSSPSIDTVVQTTRNGDLVIVHRTQSARTIKLLRYGRIGQLLFANEFDTHWFSTPKELVDGDNDSVTVFLDSIGVLGPNGSGAGMSEAVSISRQGELRWHTNFSGAQETVAIHQPAIVTDSAGRPVAAFLDSDHLHVRAWNTDAQPHWQRQFQAGSSAFDNPSTRLWIGRCGVERLCISSGRRLFLLHESDGRELASLPNAEFAVARSNGQLVTVGRPDSPTSSWLTHVHRTYSDSGTLLGSRTFDSWPVAVSGQGTTLAIVGGACADGASGPAVACVHLVDGNGNMRSSQMVGQVLSQRIPIDPPYQLPRPHWTPALIREDDRGLVLATRCADYNCSELHLVALNGTAQQPVGSAIGLSFLQTTLAHVQPLHDGDAAASIIYVDSPDSQYWRDNLQLLRSTIDGESRWNRRWTSANRAETQVFDLPADNALVLTRRLPSEGELALTFLDAATGEVRAEQSLSCSGLHCHQWHVDVAADGALSAIGLGVGGAQLVRVNSLPANHRPGLRVGQAAFDNAWYNPATSGQGLTLHSHPQGPDNSLFLAWFAYDHTPTSDAPRQLRWYTAQGEVPGQAVWANLTLYASIGGRFLDSSREVETRAVGQVRLSFHSCEEGVLEYRIDGDTLPTASGSMPLQRLLPLTSDCALADGNSIAAEQRLGPASGTWYDPATDGQGLEMLQSVDAQGRHTIFGAWYTFKPQAEESPEQEQHWFTLGEFTEDGRVLRGNLYQSLGGQFDHRRASSTTAVGVVELRVPACDRLDLHYRFNQESSLEGFRGRTGTIALQRIGQCPNGG